MKDPALAQIFVEASRTAFSALVDQALEKRVDFMIVAGDVYDGDWKDNKIGLFFNREIARLDRAGIPVFLLKGNHDAESVITRTITLPGNVREFPVNKPGTFKLEHLKVALHGQGFAERSASDNLALGYPRPEAGWFNIGVLHTSLTGREPHAPYAPCSIEDLRSRGYDYWALGHVHEFEIVQEDPLVVFPGNLQGRSIREQGAKGAVLVTVEDGYAQHERLVTDAARFAELAVDVTEAEDLPTVLGDIERFVGQVSEGMDDRPLALRIRLTGKSRIRADLLARGEDLRDEVQAACHRIDPNIWLEKLQLRLDPTETAAGSPSQSLGLDGLVDIDLLSESLLGEAQARIAEISARLPGGDAKLHIVYGPNEAGKSSALSAISDLLFGFPDRSDYGFLHDSASLRVGARLTSRELKTLTFRRRKGRKNTLLCATEAEEPLPEDALSPFLGTLSRDVFLRAFGLNSASLRAGGEMMLKSGGEIGSLLFSAASGLSGLTALRKTLDAEADAIYSPRKAKDRRFYQVLDAHEAARKAERESELRSSDWKKLLADEQDLATEAAALQQERERTKRALERLRKLIRLEPIIREIDKERALLLQYQSISGLPETFADQLEDLLDRSARHTEGLKASEAEFARLRDDIAEVQVDSALIVAAPTVLAAHADRGAYVKAREDLARVSAEVDEFDQKLFQASRRLGIASPDELQRAQPADADLARLRALVDEGAELDRQFRQIKLRLEEEHDAFLRLQSEHGDGRLVDPKPWADQLAALRPEIAELAALEAATVRVERASTELRAAAMRLDPPVADVEAILGVPLPDVAAIGSQRQAIERAGIDNEQARQRLAALRDETAIVADQLAVLESQGRVVSPEAIAAAREERDLLLGRFDREPSASTLGEVKEAIRHADELADAAIFDAERLSRRSQLLLRQRELERAQASAERDAKEADIALSDALTEFEDLFRQASIKVLAPDRMMEWRRGVDRLSHLSEALDDARDNLEALRLKEEQIRPVLAAVADAVGVAGGALPVRSLARELDSRLEELATHWNEQRTLERLKKSAEEALVRLQEREGQSRHEIDGWQARFAAAASAAGLAEDATLEMAVAAIDAWRVVPSLIAERENRVRRVRGMSRDMERFENQVRLLCEDLAPDMASLPADVAVGLLNERIAAARSAQDRRQALSANLQRVELLHNRLAAEKETISAELATLAEQAQVEQQRLPSLLEDLREKSRLEASLQQCRMRYGEHADGSAEEEMRAELADFDRVGAAMEIERLEAEDERQVERLKALGIAQANNDRRREELETGMGAERAVFEKLAAEEEAKDLARRWVVLKLAGSLLAQSMETYRERQADPVMKRAALFFQDLTGGRFTRLLQVYDEGDELRLAAERNTGEQVPLSGLSEGTGDQLYLALRLAFLEDYCSRNEPAPLILDDIFQTFDDERTRAGLRALAGAGARFQTILFTHQGSIVDAARDELGSARLHKDNRRLSTCSNGRGIHAFPFTARSLERWRRSSLLGKFTATFMRRLASNRLESVRLFDKGANEPRGRGSDPLTALIANGRCTVTRIPADRWDLARFWHPVPGTPGKTYTYAAGVIDSVYDFDPAVFGLSQREAMQMDPQQRVLLTLVWKALEDANLPASSLAKERVGVYIGASSLESGNLSSEDPASGSPYFMTGNTLSIVSNRISHVFGLNGPSMTIDTACSSSLVALDQAARALERGDIDTAIVGGVNILVHPLSFVGFAQARMLSPEGLCRAYDTNGHGYVRSEGGAALVLRRTDRARQQHDRSYARIHATGVNSSGRTNGISLPSREAQADLLRSIYQGNGIDVNRVAFIEGHGTGTRVGDPAEVWAIGSVIGQNRRAPLPIGSIKSNIGHTEPVSGLFGLFKAMIALEKDYLPATLHIEKTNEDIDFDALNVRVNTSALKLLPAKEPRLAGVNSFGFGGTNAHVVIGDPERTAVPDTSPKGDNVLFLASAHSASALQALLQDYRDRLANSDPQKARQLIAATTTNRDPLRHRFAVDTRGEEAVIQAISDHLAGEASEGERGEAPSHFGKLAFVFSGNGAQWAGMGVDAYRENRHFRQYFQSFSALFEYHLGEKLTDLITAEDLNVRLADATIAQPLLFAVQAAISDCLGAYGVRPDVVFGHSVGEIAAAYASKALTAAEAVAIVAKRSRSQHLFAGQGKMAAVVMGQDAAVAFAQAHGLTGICVAAINAPNSVTISGPTAEIQAFRDAARKAQVVAHILDINYPFHHPIIDSARDGFLADLPAIEPQSAACIFVSTVTGGIQDGRGLDAEYWWRNVREPVLFRSAAEVALDLGCNLFIEISPRTILSNYVTEVAKAKTQPAVVIGTLQREATIEGRDPVARSLARAIAHGAVPVESRHSAKRNAFASLPPLPFEPTSLRMPATTDEIDVFGRELRSRYTLLGWRNDPNGSHWKNHIDAQLFPDLAEHVVDSRAILPGSGFLDIAITAAQAHFGTDDVEISNMEIVRPLELRPDRMLELSTLLSPETGNIEIRSRERLSNDDWTVHAVGRCRRPVEGELARLDMVERLGEGASLAAAEVYETAARFGLDYGPRFQLLSKAVAFGNNVVEVDLKRAEVPAHPYISYNLNPFSVDAAFHGLVAMFDRLSGSEAGSPYIPVRFGSVRVTGAGQEIAKALIEIERFSSFSIKVNFRLFNADGEQVASLTDCRFRRTALRRHHTLDTVAFHYEQVPSSLASNRNRPVFALPQIVHDGTARAKDNASLMLDAAVYRAAHEIALSLSDRQGIVSSAALPEERSLRAFVTSCLFSLEDAGIATATDDGWSVPQEFTFPSVSELVQEIYREDSSRVAEAVLVNDVYRDALERLSLVSLHGTTDLEWGRNVSEATLDHVHVHSPLGQTRASKIVELVQSHISANAGTVRTIVELGTISTSVSARLADMAAAIGARLIIAEPREAGRRMLELAFENSVHVSVLDLANLSAAGDLDLIVASGLNSQALLANDEDVRQAVRSAASRGAAILLADRSPSAFNDFAFGLNETWFAASQSPDFPIGQLGTPGQVESLLADLGFTAVVVEDVATAQGSLVVAGAVAAGAATVPAAAELPITALAEPVSIRTVADHRPRWALVAAEALQPDQELSAFVVYIADRGTGEAASETSVGRLSRFAHLAEGLTRAAGTGGGARPRLIIVASGGSPLAAADSDEANAGLWTFARVLQNEYDAIDVHMLDAKPEDPATFDLVAAIAADQGANREWVAGNEGLVEIRAASGPLPGTESSTTVFDAATIRQLTSGRVDSIVWERCEQPEPAEDEVVIAVEAAGLNFRDVMWSMGLLPEEALEDGFAGATIGMEMAGRVERVGSAVKDLVAGDRVMGIGPAAFSTHVRVRRDGVTKFPERMDFAAAATVPVAFLTAYYAMVQLAHIEPGETILIHGAAGGVGLAALQIAKLKGATVIATAGTVEKRRFLETVGADYIFDSRSLDFVSRVRGVTGGQGVDLVLNSLFSEAMERSLELVKPFGRFLELGKRDYYSDRKIGLRPFRRNISYFGIDADQLLVNLPAVTKKIFAEIGKLFQTGELAPLPYRAFGFDEIGSAFRLMQNAGHIGKIVIRPPVSGRDRVATGLSRPVGFSGDGVFLVAGGIGGFGLVAAEWLVAKGAKRIALCSRRGVADEQTALAVEKWAGLGVTASVHACDITDRGQLSALLSELRKAGPIKGVIHAAMVLDDALLSNLTEERNRPVVDVKVKGAQLLDELTRGDQLELLLLFSSATTMLGNPGQANYVLANGYLEGLARRRRAEGRPALAVGFGAIADTGFLARNAEVNEMLSKRIGKTAMKARDALEQVEQYLARDPGTVNSAAVMIAEVDWGAVRMLPIANASIFEAAMRSAGSQQSSSEGDRIDLEELIRGKSADEAQTLLYRLVASEIATILRVTEDSITPEKILKDVGLDSLMAMELGMSFQQKTGYDIPLSGVGEDTTVSDVVTRLRERVSKRSGEDEAPQDESVPSQEGAKRDFLEQMRQTSEASGRNRAARLNRQPAAAVRPVLKFDQLPEYQRVLMQRKAGELIGVANPFYRSHDSAAGATTRMAGREFANFASYDYLATNTDPHVAERAAAALARYGISASASRLVAGERPVHTELETALARIYGVEAAVCFVSGYLTNVAAIGCLVGPQDLVIHDEFIHNSALAGIKQSGATRRLFRHNDVDNLEMVLKTLSGEFRRILVVVEGVYSMDGDIADLPRLIELRNRYGFWLMVDEAHALGVLGNTGRGSFEHFGVDPGEVDIWMGTLSKTTSSCGGYIAGSQALADILKAEAGGFVYSVGLSPVLAAAATAALEVLQSEPQRTQRLHDNGALFLRLAKEAGLDTGLSLGFSVVPVIVGDSLRAVQLSNELLEEGVNALPIIHPAVPEGMARLRFFITCNHTDEQIRHAVEATARRLKGLRERNFGLSALDMEKMMQLSPLLQTPSN
eukprot:g20017.t1